MASLERFINDGLDPIHAVYAFVQNITCFFSEGVSQMPEMKKFAESIVEAAVSPLRFAFTPPTPRK